MTQLVDTLLDNLEKNAGAKVMEKAQAIQLLVMDVDGVHTDGGLIHGAEVAQFKRFHARDGFGMKLLRKHAIPMAFITGRTSQVVEERASEIGATICLQGIQEKGPALLQVCEEMNMAPAQTAYIGDDLIDLPAMQHVGLAIATADAHPLVAAVAHWQTSQPGGSGAVRDACELILHAQGKLRSVYADYWPCD
ncbi:MAG: HAD hydrolase family protein [Gammaproteobacteria bacterium]|nr:HAD hydrolase family protein [Gammaproteobacteria bacterium]